MARNWRGLCPAVDISWGDDNDGSLTRNKFLMISVTTLENMTYIQNMHRFRGFKLTSSLIEELTYEIDV
jgi:hypothetical protein